MFLSYNFACTRYGIGLISYFCNVRSLIFLNSYYSEYTCWDDHTKVMIEKIFFFYYAKRMIYCVYPLLSHIIKTNFSFQLYLILRLGSSLRNVISCYCICHFLTHELWLWSSMSRRMDQVYVTPYGAIYKVHSLQEMSYMTNLISCLLGGKSCLLDKKGWLALFKKYDVIVIYC
jgi:hypothetical protein